MKKFIKFTNIKMFTSVDRERPTYVAELVVDADTIESLCQVGGVYLVTLSLMFMVQVDKKVETVKNRVDLHISKKDYEIAKEILLEAPKEKVPQEPIFEEEIVTEDPQCIVNAEKELIYRALSRTGGNRCEAADLLGISERTLYRKMKKYDL